MLTDRLALRRTAAALGVCAVLALSACSGGGGGAADEAAPDITYQFVGPPLSGLNPAATGGTTSAYAYAVPAYSTLLSQRVTGEIVGDLATEWGYPEGDNLRFDVTLRDDANFAGGDPVDAEAVKRSLEYVRDGGFYLSPRFSAFESIEVTGEHSLSIHLSSPVPNLPFVLTASGGAGFIIDPAALDDPDSLENGTAGSGPYVYDPDRSVIDSTYVFERNDEYYSPDAVKADSLTVQVITEPNAAISALQAGQVDVIQGGPTTAPAAESSGLDIFTAGGSVNGLSLLDRGGEVVPALGDVRVRQAINYAIDRESITEGILPGGYGVPSEQLVAEGQPGYDPELVGRYGADLDEAKRLMREAGYGDGFAFDVLCSETVNNCQAAEAVTADLAKIGIDATIVPVGVSTGAFDEKVASGEYPAAMQRMRTVMTEFGPQILPDDGGSSNPFRSEDAEVTRLWEAATAETDPDAQAELYRQVSARVVDLAWFAPLYVQSSVYFANPDLKGFHISDENSLYSPFDVEGEYTWTK